MEKVKLGIIGCGLAAKELHLPAILKLKDKFEVTAVCNHTEPKAKEFSEILGGIPYYLDYKEMLERGNVDAVDIALPIDLNYEVTRDALVAGKHILLEKPIASTLTEAQDMLGFPKKYGKVILVAENFRYRKVYKQVAGLINSGEIGIPYAAMWNLYYNVSEESKYAKTEWRKYHKYPGGFMSDAGVHNIAAIRLLFGEILSVSSFTKTINPGIGTPDTMSIQFSTAKNVSGVYNIFFTVNGHWEDKFLIFGDKGSLEINTNLITVKKEDNPPREIDAGDDHGYYKEFNEFYEAIINGAKVKSTLSEGYRDLRVVLTALHSAESGKNIILNSCI